MRFGDKRVFLSIAAVFEVLHGGLITTWRDYFDSAEFRSQASAD